MQPKATSTNATYVWLGRSAGVDISTLIAREVATVRAKVQRVWGPLLVRFALATIFYSCRVTASGQVTALARVGNLEA